MTRRALLIAAGVTLAGVAALLVSSPSDGGRTAAGGATASAAPPPGPARYRYTVVNTFPHDPGAFTQGLVFRDGVLFESTGCGRGSYDGVQCVGAPSDVRRVRLETGEVLQRTTLDARYFGEGLVDWQDSLVQLTWQSNVGFVRDIGSFAVRRQFAYAGEGWGLTHDGSRLIMSDGSSTLRVLDPDTLEETGRLPVTERGLSVNNLNELEMVRGEIYANIWQTDEVVVIDPATGHVTARIDFSGLRSRLADQRAIDVLNGIAYDADGDRLFLTGKLWPQLFEVRILKE